MANTNAIDLSRKAQSQSTTANILDMLDMLESIKMLTFRNESLCFATELLRENTDLHLDSAVYKTLNGDYEDNLASTYDLISTLKEELRNG